MVTEQPQKTPIKIGAKLVSHSRFFTFQMAEVTVPEGLLAEILLLIAEFQSSPSPASA